MRFRTPACILVTLATLCVPACSDRDTSALPSGPQLAKGPPSPACDLKDAVKYARDYFPGNGTGSIKDQALTYLSQMETACNDGEPVDYTNGFYNVAALIEQILAPSGPSAGAPVTGDALIWELIKSPTRDAVFDPCKGEPDCKSWKEFPTRPTSGFVGALSPTGTWAVVTTGSAAVCAGHRSPCGTIDPSPTADGPTWGVEPSATWNGALHGRRSLLFGNPLTVSSPTGEPLYGAGTSAYTFNLIPHPKQFDPPSAVLDVGLCSAVPASQQALIQKGSTVLEQVTIGFCPAQTAEATPSTFWGHLAAAIGGLFDPRPRALAATVFLKGPGGGAGSWSDFWAIDVPTAATFEFVNPPVDGTAGQPLVGADPTKPVSIKAITTSMHSPIENVAVTISFQKNNGFLQAGEVLAGGTLTCDPVTGTCTGHTQADQDPSPGHLKTPITLTKTGAYRMCVTGALAPLVFNTVCYGPFNIRP